MLTVFPPVAFMIAVTAWAFRKKIAYYEHSEKLNIYIYIYLKEVQIPKVFLIVFRTLYIYGDYSDILV